MAFGQGDSVGFRDALCRRKAPSAVPTQLRRTTEPSDLAVLLCSQRNEREGDVQLVDDLLDDGRSFDGHGADRTATSHASRRFESVSGQARRRSAVLLLVVIVFLDDFDAAPAPVHVMALDESVGDVHHFDEVHLLAVGSVAWVFEDNLFVAVG